MSDPLTEALARFTQKQREIAANLILAGECQPDEALNRAKALAQAYFVKRNKLDVVVDNTAD